MGTDTISCGESGMAHDIDIQIRPDGSFSFEVKGVKGRKCQDLTKFLEELGQTLSTETTSEFYQAEVQEKAPEHEHVRVGKKG
jgi:hypothetical protein